MQHESFWIERLDDESLSIRIDVSVYSLEALFRACYSFTDRCYLFMQPEGSPSTIRVRFTRKVVDGDLDALVGDFGNELISQRVRRDIAAETKIVRDLIVAQAFTEADFLGDELTEASYLDDPKGITQ